jgi:transposase InsO family protein
MTAAAAAIATQATILWTAAWTSRIAASILPDEKKESAVAFLKAAVAYYASLGAIVAHVMTDNGSCYRSKAFRDACRDLGATECPRRELHVWTAPAMQGL